MFRNILVPLDGSAFGEHALPLAASIARASGASLHILHVHRTLEATYAELQVFDQTLDQDLRRHEQQYLADVKQRLEKTLPGKVQIANVEGPIVEALLKKIREANVDLAVLTTHARGMLGRFWLGSVTNDMIRESPIPLILVHPGPHRPEFDRDVLPKNLLIPLDGSDVAERILEPATEFAKMAGGKLKLLRVLSPVIASVPAAGAFGNPAGLVILERVEELQKQLRTEGEAYLKKVSERLRSQGFAVETELATEDQPGVGILNQAKPPIDMIVIKTHGRRGLSRLVMGSVADKVIRGTTIPVMIRRPKEA